MSLSKTWVSVLLLSSLATPSISAADTQIVLEPLAGYSLGSYTQGSVSGSYNGPIFGARPGLVLGNITLGLNLLGALSVMTDDSSSRTNSPGTLIVGSTASYELPALPLRFLVGIDYVNYLWWFQLNSSIVTERFTTSGFGFRAGAGYLLHEYIRFNAELVVSSLTVTGEGSTGEEADGINATQFQFSISAPIMLAFSL